MKSYKGTPGFEPGTYRSAVDCSTTELYPHEISAQYLSIYRDYFSSLHTGRMMREC